MKVLLVLIDGCRVDSLAAAKTPIIDALMEHGSWTMEAKTVSPSITLPVLYSIFTSTSPAHHGVVNNTEIPMSAKGTGTIVEHLREQGKLSAFYYNWEQVAAIPPAGALHAGLFMDTCLAAGGDAPLAQVAAPMIVQELPDFAFLYLGCLDEEGHRSGFGSKPYVEALENADKALGHVLEALKEAGKLDEYTIIVQSDHGGEGYEHFEPCPAVLTVPWIACGPGIRSGHCIEKSVTVLDTIPTIIDILEIPQPDHWEGNAIQEIFK